MNLSERRILKQITVLPSEHVAQVQWSDQILKDQEIVHERYHRKIYTREDAAMFAAEVEGAAIYMQALGWNVDG